ncbi:MAG: hypothetical protein Q7S05_03245 [bacterium]|nr:hypothetical protein [bacterium]
MKDVFGGLAIAGRFIVAAPIILSIAALVFLLCLISGEDVPWGTDKEDLK